MDKEKLMDLVNTDFNRFQLEIKRFYKEEYVVSLEQQVKKQKEIFAEIIDYLNNNISYVGEKITIKPYTDLNDLMNILKEVSE